MTKGQTFPKGKILHDCRKEGSCYISSFTADWSSSLDWFPRGITPSDVDNCIESNGALLFIEWKPKQGSVTKGQRMLLRKLTEPIWVGRMPHDRRNYSILCVGDPKTLECNYIELFKLGSTYECYPQATRDLLGRLIKSWFLFVAQEINTWPPV